MGATLEALISLQDIEHQIVDIRRQLAAKQRNVARQAAKVRAAEEALAASREDLMRTQVQMDEVDVDLKSRGEHLARLREDLNSIRTNKEYAAVLSQLNNEKADSTRLETRAFELMSEVEGKKQALTEQESTLREEEGKLESLKAQLGQAQGSFADRLASLQKQRDEASEKLSGKDIALFDRLSERFDGEVMAQVIQVHPRRQEYLCEGCNMSVTIERANSLMSRDEVVTCGSCGRILYMASNV